MTPAGAAAEKNIKSVMGNRVIQVKFRKADEDIFKAIKNGVKKIETRAATGGKNHFKKKAKKVYIFKNIAEMLKKYGLIALELK